MENQLNFKKYPDKVLHLFACDCASRALERERAAHQAYVSWAKDYVDGPYLASYAAYIASSTTRVVNYVAAYTFNLANNSAKEQEKLWQLKRIDEIYWKHIWENQNEN